MKLTKANDPKFVMTRTDVEGGVAIHPYGACIIPNDKEGDTMLYAKYEGNTYTGMLQKTAKVGDTITLTKHGE